MVSKFKLLSIYTYKRKKKEGDQEKIQEEKFYPIRKTSPNENNVHENNHFAT
jgi:hypothetical protein